MLRLSGRGSLRASLATGHKGSCGDTSVSTLLLTTWNGSFSLHVRVPFSLLMMELSWYGYLGLEQLQGQGCWACYPLSVSQAQKTWCWVLEEPMSVSHRGLMLYHGHRESSMLTILNNHWNHSSKFLIISPDVFLIKNDLFSILCYSVSHMLRKKMPTKIYINAITGNKEAVWSQGKYWPPSWKTEAAYNPPKGIFLAS